MAHLYHPTSSIPPCPAKEPSNRGSGLGEKKTVSISPGGMTSLVESPGPEKSTVKVCVVGAGIAGLRAASVLQRHGVDVVVLEGRDRIGGRIRTTRNAQGVPRDIGQSMYAQVVADTELQTLRGSAVSRDWLLYLQGERAFRFLC
jgi:polyamine oxidase